MFFLATVSTEGTIALLSSVLKPGLSTIHTFCLSFALCFLILAIIRNYQQFGKQIGIDFIASLLLSLVLIFCFGKICTSVTKACNKFGMSESDGIAQSLERWSTSDLISDPTALSDAGKKIKELEKSRSLAEGSWWDWMMGEEGDVEMIKFIDAKIDAIKKKDAAQLKEDLKVQENYGWAERKIIVPVFEFLKTWGRTNFKLLFLLRCLLLVIYSIFLTVLLSIKPLFLSCLCVPEARNHAVSYMFSCLSLSLIPLAFYITDAILKSVVFTFADMSWISYIGSNGRFYFQITLSYFFSSFFVLLAGIPLYIVIPGCFLRLFRSGAPGSPVGGLMHMAGLGVRGATAAPGVALSVGKSAAGIASSAGKTASGLAKGYSKLSGGGAAVSAINSVGKMAK